MYFTSFGQIQCLSWNHVLFLANFAFNGQVQHADAGWCEGDNWPFPPRAEHTLVLSRRFIFSTLEPIEYVLDSFLAMAVQHIYKETFVQKCSKGDIKTPMISDDHLFLAPEALNWTVLKYL